MNFITPGNLAVAEERWSEPWSARDGWALVVLALAVLLRVYQIGSWSLSEDEETAIYFTLNLDRPFPVCMPVFFRILSGAFQLTPQWVLAGRMVAMVSGVLSIVAAWYFVRRFGGTLQALIASVLMAVCVEHVYWSQAVRYYTLVLLLEILASHLFLEGLRGRSSWRIFAGGLLLLGAMLTHTTAVLLLPVWLGFLGYLAVTRNRWLYDNLRGLTASAVLIAPAVLFLLIRFNRVQSMGATGMVRGISMHASAENMDFFVPFLVRLAAFHSPVVMGLAGLAALWVLGKERSNWNVFLVFAAFLPVAEACVIGFFAMTVITVHHIFYCIFGFSGLAALAIATVCQHRRRAAMLAACGGVVAYAALSLGLYFTALHGNRPRWREAAQLIKEQEPDLSEIQVVATSPGVMAHYLGVPPEATMECPRFVRSEAELSAPGDAWHVLSESGLSPKRKRELERRCELMGRFPAEWGPVVRTLVVYRARGPQESARRDAESEAAVTGSEAAVTESQSE